MNRALVQSVRPFLRLAARGSSQSELTELLYQRWFIDWRAPGNLQAQSAGDERFVAELAQLAGTDTWLAPEWVVTSRAGDRAFVSNGAVQLYVHSHQELVPKAARVGAAVRLRIPCARGCATPGFFLLVSRRGRATHVHDKLYLHLTPEGGRAVIERLRRLDARFEVKVANAIEAYGRRDSGVVYVDPRDVGRVVRALRPLSVQRRLFRASVPPLTQRLGRGLAIAEPEAVDAEAPTSFGDDRCRLVATALLRADGDRSSPLAAHLSACFREAGLDPSAPWRRSR